jgi:hypothetical protein
MEKFSVRTEKFFLLPPLLSLVFLVWICSFVWLSDLQFAGKYVLLRIDSSLNSGEGYGEILSSDACVLLRSDGGGRRDCRSLGWRNRRWSIESISSTSQCFWLSDGGYLAYVLQPPSLTYECFPGFQRIRCSGVALEQASKLPSRQVIDKQGGSVQADADMLWQVRWKKVRAHNLVCSCESISFGLWYCVVGVLLLHFCLPSPTHLY